MSQDPVYAKNPDFIQRDVAGECILVPIKHRLSEANSIYVLNETGAALWNRIDGNRSVQQIMSEFRHDFDVTPEQLSQDTQTLLTDLLSIKAIEEVTQ